MVARAAVGFVLTLLGSPAGASTDPCPEVQKSIDGYARTFPNGRILERVAPFLSERAVRETFGHLPAADERRRFDIFWAAGLARHGTGLSWLRRAPREKTALGQLGQSLALLALGDGSGTATIARALDEGPVESRRLASRALAQLSHRRAVALLARALEDEDEEVRFWAVRALVREGSVRARRALEWLAMSAADGVRLRAARALADRRTRLSLPMIERLPEPERGRLLVSEAARNSALRSRLVREIGSSDAARQVTAFATLALDRLRNPAGRPPRRAERIAQRSEEGLRAERAMALALVGEAESVAYLATLEPAGVERAVAVLVAFAGARRPLQQEEAERLTAPVVTWFREGYVAPRTGARLLHALEAIAPLVALEISRSLLNGGLKTPDLRAAARVIGRLGEASDAARLAAAAHRAETVPIQSELWRAAAAVCAR